MKNVVEKSKKLIKSGRYKKAKSMLLAYSTANKSTEALALIAHCSIFLKDFSTAETQVYRALQQDSQSVTALLAKAFLSLNTGHRENALRIYFTILDIDPTNNLAKINIEKIKFLTNSIKDGEINPRKFLIDRSMYVPRRIILTSLLTFVSVIIFYFGVNILYPIIRYRLLDRDQRELREKLESVYLFEGFEDNKIPNSATSKTYSPKEVANMFDEAKKDIRTAEVNSAIMIINGALRSDINEYLKERFRVLKTFIIPPDYSIFKDNLSYITVLSDTDLYKDTYIKWKAEVSTVNSVIIDGITKNKARILVYDENNEEIVGIADIIANENVILTPKKNIEIYAKVESYDRNQKVLNLKAQLIKHIPN